jgi:hypothetical protein
MNRKRSPLGGDSQGAKDPDPTKGAKVEVIVNEQANDGQRRAAHQLHRRGVDLARYYRGRPLLAIGLAEFLERQASGRWAA